MFTWLLNYPRSEFDAGTLSFASTLSLWLLAALIFLAAAVLGVSLWTRRKYLSPGKVWTLWILQSLVATILLSMIWRPTLVVEAITAGENTVAVLLDSSASMLVESNNTSRFAEAKDELDQNLLPDLKENFTVKSGSFSETLQWSDDFSDLTADGQRSNISSTLIDVLEQARIDPLTAVVIATDGSDNSNAISNDFWDKLASYNVPVHTIGVGEIRLTNDTEIVSIDMPPVAAPGSVQTARVSVQHGEQNSLRVKVYSGDDIIAIEDKQLSGDAGETTVEIDINATEAGIQELRFEAEGTDRDISPGNNSRKRLLQVAESERKILYFEGEPRWEYKFIRRALHKVPGISLVTILRTTPNKFYRQGIDSPTQHANGFPETKAELYLYDAVIIGNVESISLNGTQQQLIHDYVSERGGSLLMLAGDKTLSDGGWQNSPVATTLPVEVGTSAQPTFQRLHATANLAVAGSHSPITRFDSETDTNELQWSELPPLADVQLTGDVKPGANILLTATAQNEEVPLLIHQRYGAGNSYVLATSGTWRWQMQLPSEDQRHEIFWRQLLTSAAAGAPQQMQTRTDRQIYNDEQLITLTTKLFDEEFSPMPNGVIDAVLISPDGTQNSTRLKPLADEAGVYSATANAPQTGSWQINFIAKQADGTEVNAITQWIHREDGIAEQFALAQNDTLLKRISATTNGNYFNIDNATDIAETLRTSRSGIVREQSLPLWNAPLFFLLLIGLKLFEWILRLFWGRL